MATRNKKENKIEKNINIPYNEPMANCYFCGAEIPNNEKIYRNSTCTSCGNPLKICRHCSFYDPGAAHECREHITEPVRNKEQANFCEFFVLTDTSKTGSQSTNDARKKAIDTFNSLFSDD